MPDSDSNAYDSAAALLLKQTSSIAFKALSRSGSFDEYEQILGIVSPLPDFRRQLSVEIARYLNGAWMEAARPGSGIEQKVKAASHNLKISRNRLNRAQRPLVGNAKHGLLFVEWARYQREFEELKLPRGRVKKESAALFVQRAAAIFGNFTDRAATIINNAHEDNGGPFGKLLQAITGDTLRLAEELKIDRSRLSANLARLARKASC